MYEVHIQRCVLWSCGALEGFWKARFSKLGSLQTGSWIHLCFGGLWKPLFLWVAKNACFYAIWESLIVKVCKSTVVRLNNNYSFYSFSIF